MSFFQVTSIHLQQRSELWAATSSLAPKKCVCGGWLFNLACEVLSVVIFEQCLSLFMILVV